MLKIAKHISNAKHILLMCFVLFALSPCVAKAALFGMTNAEYAKPLNKSKTNTQTNSCQYTQNNNQQFSTVKKATVKKQAVPIYVLGNQYFAVSKAKMYRNCTSLFSGNSPPKYILYKRLKLDIA